MDSTALRMTVGRRLALGFAAVTAIFVVALASPWLPSSAGGDWRAATAWDHAVAGADDQLRGTQQQMAAQALYVATSAPRYKAEWEQGVATLRPRRRRRRRRCTTPTVARIANAANAADHRHDAAVNERLFPAVARGDRRAAARRAAPGRPLRPRAARRRSARSPAYVSARRANDIAHAKAAERDRAPPASSRASPASSSPPASRWSSRAASSAR